MIIYNVTVKIDLSAHDLWLNWIKEEHIPDMLSTGCFVSSKMYRVLQEDETDGITYSIQYFAENITKYFDYKEHFANEMQQRGLARFEGKFVAFRTLLREV